MKQTTLIIYFYFIVHKILNILLNKNIVNLGKERLFHNIIAIGRTLRPWNMQVPQNQKDKGFYFIGSSKQGHQEFWG